MLNVLLPYPAGYDYDSVGVTYEARTFDKYEGHTFSDHDNVEKVNCVPTPYGLLVDMTVFSAALYGNSSTYCNYSVAVLPTAPAQQNVTYVVIDGEGTVFGQYMQFDATDLQIAANAGYVIDSIVVNGAAQELQSRNQHVVNLNDGVNLVKVTFVEYSVFCEEQEAGYYSPASKLDNVGGGETNPSEQPSTSPDQGGNEGGNGGASSKPGFSCNFGGAIGAGNIALIVACLAIVGVGKSVLR